MENSFFDFVKQYRDDIVAFLNSLVELIKTIFDKLGQEDATQDTTAAV